MLMGRIIGYYFAAFLLALVGILAGLGAIYDIFTRLPTIEKVALEILILLAIFAFSLFCAALMCHFAKDRLQQRKEAFSKRLAEWEREHASRPELSEK